MPDFHFCILGSGSKGNACYVEADGEALLVDCGLSARTIGERLSEKNLDASKIGTVLLTHYHSDHIRGADVFLRRTGANVFATKDTLKRLPEEIQSGGRGFEVQPATQFEVGKMSVRAIPNSHDAPGTVSYSIAYLGRTFTIITDLGVANEHTHQAIAWSDVLVFESNHDLTMLEHGPYPWPLIRRIKSAGGHLSNEDSADAIKRSGSERMKLLVLAHLSEQNNSPEIALDTMKNAMRESSRLTKAKLMHAEPHDPSDVMEI
ncbi:MAG: MBL fold metallo-hydrolase [Planctomycetes bacterium]|nr:MBL fold metallo-hydrolase [Planctomycetota bacterium]